MSKKMALTLESDTLNAFKTDFNQMLRKLLRTMEEQEAEEGTLNAKITVKLKQDQTRDFQTNGYDGMRDIVKPTFDHKVGITLQFKDEKSGSLGGNYEMVWDKDLMAYVMVEINNGQTSMFDNEKEEQAEDDAAATDAGAYDAGKAFAQGVIDGMNEAKQLDGSTITSPALPEVTTAEDEVIEAEFIDVEEDNLKERIEEFEHAAKYVGEDMKILHSGGDLYSVRTKKRGSIFLTSAGTAKGPFYIAPEICAAHIDHELICCLIEDNVLLKCIECDDGLWAMENPEKKKGWEYEDPEE